MVRIHFHYTQKTVLTENLTILKLKLHQLSGPKITFWVSKERSLGLVSRKKRTNAFGVLWRKLWSN